LLSGVGDPVNEFFLRDGGHTVPRRADKTRREPNLH
jgi:hypothetical protein